MRGWNEFHPRMDCAPSPHGIVSIPAWNEIHRRTTSARRLMKNALKPQREGKESLKKTLSASESLSSSAEGIKLSGGAIKGKVCKSGS